MKELLQNKIEALTYYDARISIKDKILRKMNGGGINMPFILDFKGRTMPLKFLKSESDFELIRSVFEK